VSSGFANVCFVSFVFDRGLLDLPPLKILEAIRLRSLSSSIRYKLSHIHPERMFRYSSLLCYWQSELDILAPAAASKQAARRRQPPESARQADPKSMREKQLNLQYRSKTI